MTNIVMDREAVPKQYWLLAMLYCVFILNMLAHSGLDWKTPHEVAFGETPDISPLLCFHFFEPALHRDPHDPAFPDSKEKPGRFIGFAPNKGDALTFQILTDDTQEVTTRSVVRPANDDANPN